MLLMGALLVLNTSCKKEETIIQLTDSSTSDFTDKILSYYQQSIDSAAYYIKTMDTSLTREKIKSCYLMLENGINRLEPIDCL